MIENKSLEKAKRVSFSEVIDFHNICMCEEHKSARTGLIWFQHALDRNRFHQRIKTTNLLLNFILQNKISKYEQV